MNSAWELIAHSLRDELQEYGGLIGLFEEQQGALFRRDASGVLASVSAIEEQARAAGSKRLVREQLVRDFALSIGYPEDAKLRTLLEHFPVEVRTMLEALIDEVNRLVHRARRGVRQNTLLLQRAIELHQETLRSLRPESITKTYSPRGHVSIATTAPSIPGSLQAVG